MEVSADEKDLFLTISTHLTGFNEAELHGTGMLDAYYATIVKNNAPSDLRYFFEQVAVILEISKKDEKRLHEAIALDLMPLSAYSGLAQNIITLWYTGNWANTPVSAQAYQQGLVWDAAEAHPPGAKQPGFGSWSLPPL
jgi:hypothetical protein